MKPVVFQEVRGGRNRAEKERESRHRRAREAQTLGDTHATALRQYLVDKLTTLSRRANLVCINGAYKQTKIVRARALAPREGTLCFPTQASEA